VPAVVCGGQGGIVPGLRRGAVLLMPPLGTNGRLLALGAPQLHQVTADLGQTSAYFCLQPVETASEVISGGRAIHGGDGRCGFACVAGKLQDHVSKQEQCR
jgi:hypothetical protein